MNKILVGMWSSAPFKGSVKTSIDDLNKYLKDKYPDIKVEYELALMDYGSMVNNSRTVNKELFKDIKLFVFDGGEDVNPAEYGEDNRYSYFNTNRDKIEKFFYNKCFEYKIRMSGICRGHQLINVMRGGRLFQDIRRDGLIDDNADHSTGHKVTPVKDAKRLQRYYDGMKSGSNNKKSSILTSNFLSSANPFTVSSLHHQAVRELGEGLKKTISYFAGRGGRTISHSCRYNEVIEGIESYDGKVRGLQCHPEFRSYPKDGILFSYLMHVDSLVAEFLEVDEEAIKNKKEQFKEQVYKVETSKKLPKPSRPRLNTDRLEVAMRQYVDIDDRPPEEYYEDEE